MIENQCFVAFCLTTVHLVYSAGEFSDEECVCYSVFTEYFVDWHTTTEFPDNGSSPSPQSRKGFRRTWNVIDVAVAADLLLSGEEKPLR